MEVLAGVRKLAHTQAWSGGPGGANAKGRGDRERHGEYTEVEKQGGWERAGRGNARRDKKKARHLRGRKTPAEKPDSGFWRERCPGNSGP